jgi:hypothetical protein
MAPSAAGGLDMDRVTLRRPAGGGPLGASALPAGLVEGLAENEQPVVRLHATVLPDVVTGGLEVQALAPRSSALPSELDPLCPIGGFLGELRLLGAGTLGASAAP